MSKIWVIQHIHCETLGIVADILESRGFSTQYIRPYKGQEIPAGMNGTAGLILIGGPMGVYDHPQYPFLKDEIRLIEYAIKENKPVLGICLGSQLMAAALGTPVRKGKKKEIGWYPVKLLESAKTDQLWTGVGSPFMAYHWHGDIFDLPQGAIQLASSDLTGSQAFRYNDNAYGILFHMEITEGIIRNMIRTFKEELKEAHIDGQEIIGKTRNYLSPLQKIGGLVFQRWTGLLKEY